MHQQGRMPPRSNTSQGPASSPQTNPARTNNPRDAVPSSATGRPRAASTVSTHEAMPPPSPLTDNAPALSPPAEAVKKLDQIVQNFFIKAAVLILTARTNVRPIRTANGQTKINKWYQIDTEEIDDFKDELRSWKNCGSIDNQPPSMIIETYLDTSRLKDNQSLVVLDDEGKRWDVMEQLGTASASSSSSSSGRPTKVLLERWKVDLVTTGDMPTEDFGPILPTIYKKAIVFFRSLFITTRLLPSWKTSSHGPSKVSHPALVHKCRITTSEPGKGSPDFLRIPISGRSDAVTEYVFGDLETPVGRLQTSVAYRNDCNFRVDDSEALLSSQFMGVDENFFKPSFPQRGERQRDAPEVGSLGGSRRRSKPGEIHQTYGSMSTFHGGVPLGTSPISALRAVRVPGSDTSSPPASLPTGADGDVPHSLPISSRPSITSRPPLRVGDGSGRRPSISFQPFKAGSLSGSPIPRQADSESPASPHSLTRPAALPPLQQPRNRSSLTAGMPASLRGGPPAQPATPPAELVGSSSPRPSSTAGRYSSSFTHRRGRLSFGGTSRAGDDEQNSSGKQSLSSSVAQPGSGLLAETEAASSGSLPGDDNITDFLKVLDSKRSLKSFETTRQGESATNRTVAQLSKFHMMKESNNALTDSMTSSMQMHRSSSSSSRNLTSVPGMVAPASISTSSSPGKPVSPHTPHTPHTPAVPSRLSENYIIESGTNQSRAAARQGRPSATPVPEMSRESTVTQEGVRTGAIDIPLSPRLATYQRRSSSVAQQSRTLQDDNDAELAYAHRSISLGADDREPPTLSILLGRQMQLEEEANAQGPESSSSGIQAAPECPESQGVGRRHRGSSASNPPEGLISPAMGSSPFGRRRYTGMAGMAAGKRQTPPQSSRGSFTGSAGRPSRGDDESVGEEPLVFDLSEMDAQGRRSLEEGRGGGHAGYDARGSTRRGWLRDS